jgi:amino acid transporter
MYTYVCQGLGLKIGAVSGWSLIWAYLGISMAGVTGFTVFAGKLLDMTGLFPSAPVLFALCVGIAWLCAWKNVKLSAVLMLVLEGASVVLITLLCLVTLGQHGFAIDHTQFDRSTLHLSSLGLGVVVAMPVLQAPLSLGAIVSFFALCLSCINAGGRIIYAMGRHGLFPAATGAAHADNETPHIAVTLMSLVAFAAPYEMVVRQDVALLDAFTTSARWRRSASSCRMC